MYYVGVVGVYCSSGGRYLRIQRNNNGRNIGTFNNYYSYYYDVMEGVLLEHKKPGKPEPLQRPFWISN